MSRWNCLASGALVALAVAFGLSAVAAGEPVAKSKKDPADRLQKLDSAERFRLLQTVLTDADFQKVDRGFVSSTLSERGLVESLEKSIVICRLKSRQGRGMPVSTMKWIVDDGALVKKGEKLIELDDFSLKAEMETQKTSVKQGAMVRDRMEEALNQLKAENRIDIRFGELAVRLAALAVKQYTGNDPIQKELLELKAEEAALTLERTKVQARGNETKALADSSAAQLAVEQHVARLRELEGEVAKCTIVSPRDGLVLYPVSQSRATKSNVPVLAVGEPVFEGQILLHVSDMRRLGISTRITEALMSHVQTGLRAEVKVDAYPNMRLQGEVQAVSHVAAHDAWFAKGLKVYPVMVEVKEKPVGLRPGLSAQVDIVVDQKQNYLRVPSSAAVGRGPERTCYVKVGEELRERKVTIGLLGPQYVQVGGLRQGDLVLRDPRAVVERLEARTPKSK